MPRPRPRASSLEPSGRVGWIVATGLAACVRASAAGAGAASGEAPAQAQGSASSSSSASSGAGGEGGLAIDAGENDAPADPDAACASVSEEAELTKRPIDVVFFVDNSGSMYDDIAAVQTNINGSFAAVLGAAAVDYRVVVVSLHGFSDTAESICIEAPLSTTSCNPVPPLPGNNPPVFFQYSTEIASKDSWCKLFSSYDGALADDFGLAPGGWSEWLRDGAFKVFVEVSDDGSLCGPYDDNDTVAGGTAAAAAFDADLLALSPASFGDASSRRYVWHSIIGMPANVPASTAWLPADPVQLGICSTGATPGTGHQALSILTGGLRFPICEHASYDVVFQEIAENAIENAGVECSFPVPDPPAGQTIDLDTVRVQYAPGGGGPPQTFDQVASAAACGPGKFYIAADAIVLCPETCASLQDDGAAQVLVLFDCEAPVR